MNDGGPAFPNSGAFDREWRSILGQSPGMSLRDYFASEYKKVAPKELLSFPMELAKKAMNMPMQC